MYFVWKRNGAEDIISDLYERLKVLELEKLQPLPPSCYLNLSKILVLSELSYLHCSFYGRIIFPTTQDHGEGLSSCLISPHWVPLEAQDPGRVSPAVDPRGTNSLPSLGFSGDPGGPDVEATAGAAREAGSGAAGGCPPSPGPRPHAPAGAAAVGVGSAPNWWGQQQWW